MNDETQRQRALNLIQAADVSSLLAVLQAVVRAARPHVPQLPDVSELFLAQRKELLHRMLERLETKDPAMAAALQSLIDDSCTEFPFDY